MRKWRNFRGFFFHFNDFFIMENDDDDDDGKNGVLGVFCDTSIVCDLEIFLQLSNNFYQKYI